MTCSACGFTVAEAGAVSLLVMDRHMIHAHGAGLRIDHVMGLDQDEE